MENKSRTKSENCRCGFCNSEINPQSENQKYCDRICKQLAYHERRSKFLLAQKELKDLSDKLDGIHLRVIKGGKNNSEKIKKRSSQFLAFCQSLLWADKQISELEKEIFPQFIADFFQGADADEKFVELIERAILARHYKDIKSERYLSEPALWLNIQCSNGLIATERWYKEMQGIRKSVTRYKMDQAVLAKAILSYCDTANLQDASEYCRYFATSDRFDLLGIFVNALSYLTPEV